MVSVSALVFREQEQREKDLGLFPWASMEMELFWLNWWLEGNL